MVHILVDFAETNNLGKVFGSSTGYNLPSGDTLEPDVSFVSGETRQTALSHPKR